MRFKIIDKKKTQAIINYLSTYGIKFDSKFSANFMFIEQNDQIFIANKKAIEFFDIANAIGLYLGKLKKDSFRLSFDATQVFSNQITKNVLEINKKECNEWLFGLDIATEKDIKGYVVLKYKDDFVGSGLAKEGKILNYVPKERRLKKFI